MNTSNPIQNKFFKMAMLEKNDKATLLLEIIDAIDEIKQFKGVLSRIDIASLKAIKGEQGVQGERGNKGEKGEKGDTGEDGKDYVFTEADKKRIIREVISKIPTPEEVDIESLIKQVYEKVVSKKNEIVDSPLGIANKLNTLEGVLDVSVIKNYPTIASFVEDITKNRRLESHIKSYIPKKLNDQKWHGGGGSVFVNGVKTTYSNINLVGSGNTTISMTDNAGTSQTTITVNSTGGGGNLSILEATGAVDDSNVTFTFLSKPTVIVINGMTYRENHGWTWAVLTATITNPVGTGGDIYGLS